MRRTASPDGNITGPLLRLVGELLRPWRWALGLLGALLLAGTLVELVPPFLLMHVVDDHLKVGRVAGLGLLAALYLGAHVGQRLIAFGQGYLAAVVAENALLALRLKLFRHLQRLPLRYFDRTPVGDVISRCTADVDTLSSLFSATMLDVLTDAARLMGIVIAMAALSGRLTLLALLAVPPALILTHAFRGRIRGAERATRRLTGDMNARLQETLVGVEVVRAFGKEAAFGERFAATLRDLRRASNRSAAYSSLFSPCMEILSAVAVMSLLGVGGLVISRAAASGTAAPALTVGALVAFVDLLRKFFGPVTSLTEEYRTVEQALAGTERLLEVLAEPAEGGSFGIERESEGARERESFGTERESKTIGRASETAVRLPPSLALSLPRSLALSQSSRRVADIRVERISFAYTPDRRVLHGLSLAISPGRHVALIGRTGSGKTTLLHLVAGLYAPGAGAVRVAGCDPRALGARARRRLLGMVPQQGHLFAGTVAENITLNDPELTLEDVRRAAELVGAHPFVTLLPRSYDTPIGAGGLALSAGQQQLLALTRALAADPPVLLLDEATSALDAGTDAAVRQALRAGQSGRTTLTVAHRLSTARDADRILVLQEGVIVEAGAPDALRAAGGRYAEWEELAAWYGDEVFQRLG